MTDAYASAAFQGVLERESRLKAENARLRAALRTFGVHAETCPRHRLFPECTCGLAVALGENHEATEETRDA